jgi:hypothetical protein
LGDVHLRFLSDALDGQTSLMTPFNDNYCKQWKDPSNHSKGTVWTYWKCEAFEHAGVPRLEEEMGFLMGGHRHRECMRGTKWEAMWKDGTTFTIRSSPQATKPLMASIALRWRNPPKWLKREGGQPFDVETLETKRGSFVYLVRLLTFEETSSGACYYKIGKATSIPKRIKQFGPCELIAHEIHEDSASALKREKDLHQKFSTFRKHGTEIFLLNKDELSQVINEMVMPAVTVRGNHPFE